MRASKAYQALNNEQKEAIRTKQINAAKTPAEWRTFLQPIARYGRALRKAAPERGGLGGPLRRLFRAIMNVYRKLRKRDIVADLDTAVLPLLRILQEELAGDEKLHLHLHLGGLPQSTLVHASRPPQKDYPRVVVQVFQHPWLGGATQLADGTTLRFQIINWMRQVKKIKRNPRGKLKTKYTYKQRLLLSVDLGFRTDFYRLQPMPRRLPPGEKMAIKSTAKRHWVKMRRRVQFPARPTATTEALPLDIVVNAITSAFQHVTPLRKSA